MRVGEEDARDAGSADRAHQRVDMRGIGRARIEHNQFFVSDQKSVGSAKSEGAFVRRGHAPNAGCNFDGFAVARLEVAVENKRHDFFGLLAGSGGADYTGKELVDRGNFMSSAVAVEGPLVGRYIPESGAARIAAYAGFAILGSLILWASAKISVPFWPVPMTLQTGAVALVAAAYGWRLGAATVILYLLEGAIGIPVFEGTPAKGIGIEYLAGTTGGYLVGFAISAAIVGWVAERWGGSPLRLFGGMVLGDAFVFALGLLWLGHVVGWDKPLLEWGLYPFVLGDLVKLALATALFSAGARLVRR